MMNISALIETHGTFRRLLECYWLGTLTVDEEAVIEDLTPKETIAAFKPVGPPFPELMEDGNLARVKPLMCVHACDRMHVSDLPSPPDPWERKLVIYENDAEIDALMKSGWDVLRPDRIYAIGDTIELRRVKELPPFPSLRPSPNVNGKSPDWMAR